MMMSQFVDQSGTAIALGKKLGTGGEGAVFEILSNRDLVAKIYHKHAPPEKAAKLTFMASMSKPEIFKFAAWPKSTLHRQLNGPTVGIIIPRINAKEIHDLYGPSHRAINFPAADWRFLVRTALNTAAAFDTLHQNNIVIGDVNQGNVFVTNQATVNLIDCDSFQIQAQGRLFKCIVGVAEFTPPELQSVRFTNVVRTANHDNFGLAVMVFHLLFMGRHPYAGRYSGPGDMPIERAIEQYRFAYSSSNPHSKMLPPPSCLNLSEASDGVAQLFERAFCHGSANPNARPSAQEWGNVLIKLESQLRKCEQDSGHYYISNQQCPWCRLVIESGKNFFISVSLKTAFIRSDTFNIVQIWVTIKSVRRPGYVPVKRISPDTMRPKPLVEEDDPNRLPRQLTGWIAAVAGALSTFALKWSFIAAFTAPMSFVFTIWWCLYWFNKPANRERKSRKTILVKYLSQLREEQRNFQSLSKRYIQGFDSQTATLLQMKTDYEGLKSQRDCEFQELQRTARDRQLDEYLQKCFICNARISGIGPVRITTLESYGIETADDITEYQVSQVPGFGPVLTSDLLAWRTVKERQFNFDARRGVPDSARQKVELKYVQKRQQIQLTLSKGPGELRKIYTAAKSELSRLDQQVAKTETAVAQAKCDMSVF